MKRIFELTPFEKDLKNWYEEHGELMPWDLFLIRESRIRENLNAENIPFCVIDPCFRDYKNAVYDKNLGYVDLRNISLLVSGQYCTIVKQPRYFPKIEFESSGDNLFYGYSGESTVIISCNDQTEEYIIKEGDFLLVPNNTRKTLLSNSDNSVLLYFAFQSGSIEYYSGNIQYYSTGNDPGLCSLIEDIIQEAISQKKDFHRILLIYLNLLMAFIQRDYENLNSGSVLNKYDYSSKFREYIQCSYSDFSMQKMSEDFHLNASYICRLFKEYTGITIRQYLQKVRIKTAKYLLANTYDSIEAIAFNVGYSDTSYFIEVFRKSEGITPHKFRRNSL